MSRKGRAPTPHCRSSTILQGIKLGTKFSIPVAVLMKQLYSLSLKKVTQDHKSFSFCEQALYEGLIDASSLRLATIYA
jgi:hypothetical protein